MNDARGYLAELLVGTALIIQNLCRVEWDAVDLFREGTRIEVKSSAFFQPWESRKPSTIAFGGPKRTLWTLRAGEDSTRKQSRADVNLFRAHPEQEHFKFDQLGVGGWSFFVVPRAAIVEFGAQSIRMSTVRGPAADETT